MAIYYMNAKIIGRSAGRTATGAAAYRAGERIVDERTGLVFDYTRRTGEIETEILAPEGAPEWVQDRSQLWNEAEKAERRGDAQVAREIVVAFPKELDAEQQRELIRAYAREEFVSRGMVADMAIHRNPGNPHAHIMLTMREIGPDGFSAKKKREWNRPEALERWRAEWAAHANRSLDRAGWEERIDHRSLAEQGNERVPQVHLGPHASALERQGVATEKGDHNRLAQEHNSAVIDLQKAREERQALQAEKAAHERFNARIQAGWTGVHAEALQRLEVAGGGEELTERKLSERYAVLEAQLRRVTDQIGDVNWEEQRVRDAQQALNGYNEAAAELRRHESPVAAVKRWFSLEARSAHRDAQERFAEASARVEGWGVRSQADVDRRREAWQERSSQLPGLEKKAEALGASARVIEQALTGLSREKERQRETERFAKAAAERETW
ncbi:MAG TPA: MobQ family relaxase, partial [Symbiobacteriaceae bacterium]|nr:MobQ family relaxase [Symbiobacteriaceae bacterium]